MPVPSPGESISEVEIAQWLVKDGDYVEKDQTTALVKKLIKPKLTSCFTLKVSLYFFLISKMGVMLTSLKVVSIAV